VATLAGFSLAAFASAASIAAAAAVSPAIPAHDVRSSVAEPRSGYACGNFWGIPKTCILWVGESMNDSVDYAQVNFPHDGTPDYWLQAKDENGDGLTVALQVDTTVDGNESYYTECDANSSDNNPKTWKEPIVEKFRFITVTTYGGVCQIAGNPTPWVPG
jgi:hypothetical protein